MKWTHDDPITGERLQALAEITVLTRSILDFHRSLPQSGVRDVLCLPGSHTDLEPDTQTVSLLRGRRSIFVYTHLVRSFLTHVLPRLDHAFVLITHNSDHAIGPEFRPALEDPRLVHWFAQNAVIRHPKLTPLPIGIANAQWPHGNLAALVDVANRVPPPRKDVVYLNFDVRTNPAVRVPLFHMLERSPLTWRAPPRPFAQYLQDMAGCRWVISPPGNGVDCHRTWEALYLGITPIVARTDYGEALHNGLPIIQLEDLGVLDRSRLEREEWVADESALGPLKMSHWRALVGEHVRQAG